MTEHETNLRDLAAMFAMTALIIRDEYNPVALHKEAFKHADMFMQARNPTPEDGIAAIKPKRRKPNE